MSTPDVSVIVAVYNTMPYLTTCLDSLVGQTIGRDRLEVVAVDDGSTDGSGAELDRYAARFPDTVRVLHQANSGGPAAPSNLALDHARGRYVFFIGSDDHLGPEALERLVDAADRWDSDVVLGRMVGTNKRYVHQAAYAVTEERLDLFGGALAWSLSNTKLFRRELVERYGLRFRTDMPMGSDQPFTLEACFRAKKISVLGDYDYYYAVKRENAQNITYASRFEERLRCAEELVGFVAGLIEPGPRRDAVLLRHFSWEVAKLLRAEFLGLDEDVQQNVHDRIRKLAEAYLTEGVLARMAPDLRLRLAVARDGDLTRLRELIGQQADRTLPEVTISDGRWYAHHVGFRDPAFGYPDDWYDITDQAARTLAKLTVSRLAWGRDGTGARALVVTARSRWAELSELTAEAVRVSVGDLVGVTSVAPDGTGTVVRTDFAMDRLLAVVAADGERRVVRAEVSTPGGTGSAPVRADRGVVGPRRLARHGVRLYLVTPTTNHKGQVIVAITPLTPRRFLARLRRIRLSGGK
ncbi:glycosyltransferase family 2 protein [Micromonospora endolithica]|uniref:Glycosyltransferase n=1 Tax=Micromonospora endolithica TaxID=230091 RepID=A0A3A9ZBG3_9ACTN|nr:glycosyltransferase [Micromonospora endolithica]RKN45449.1 glycosyltransferase [Micromonospora endolithica]TWJ22826.1 glycosyltransferase involved in cell wall biosynthesis [Micromonospora endolithica]